MTPLSQDFKIRSSLKFHLSLSFREDLLKNKSLGIFNLTRPNVQSLFKE